MSTGVLITLIICTAIVLIMLIEKAAEVIDRNNFYRALGEHPEINNIYEEDIE